MANAIHLNVQEASPSGSSGIKNAVTHLAAKESDRDAQGWKFQYAPSKDGKESNLLIMFHGLGDTCQSFFKFAQSLNIPQTCMLSLQGPVGVPLMDFPSFSWYPSFTPDFMPIPSPTPQPTIPKLRKFMVDYVCGKLGWKLEQIHLFGWGQGGTMALELARSFATSSTSPTTQEHTGSSSASDGSSMSSQKPCRLGSVVSVCGDIVSTPSVGAPALNLETPVFYFHRPRISSASSDPPTRFTKTFKTVRCLNGSFEARRANEEGKDEAMLSGPNEWREVVKFWAENLTRREAWEGQDGVYEIKRT